MASETCFHCALPVPADCHLKVDIEDEPRPVCCPGCKAVAELIRDTGMTRYYELRDLPDPGVGRPPEVAAEWAVFDSPDMLDAFTERDGDMLEATIYVGGMYCSACSWLIETTMGRQPGTASAEVNPITHRLRLRFPEAACRITWRRLPVSATSRSRSHRKAPHGLKWPSSVPRSSACSSPPSA